MVNSSIYEKIENKGALDAKKIKEAGELQAKLQMQEAVEVANRDIEILIQKTITNNNEKIKTKVTEFEQQAKRATLALKKKLIDEMFDKANASLQELDGEDLFKYVSNLLKKDELSGDESLVVNKNDFKKYLKVFSTGKKVDNGYELDLLNKSLGKNYQLKLSVNEVDINGGFLVIGKSFDINHSFTAMLEQVKEENEAEIAKALFGKGN